MGKNHTVFASQYSRPGGPVAADFQINEPRARRPPKNFWATTAESCNDGFAGYEKIGSSQMIRTGCMAHARRKFIEVLKLDPTNADGYVIVNLMSQLAKARENKLSQKNAWSCVKDGVSTSCQARRN